MSWAGWRWIGIYVVGVLGLLAISTGIAGCNVLPNAPRDLGNCGIALEIWLRHPNESRYEFVRIDRGQFAYSAGRQALLMQTSWQTDLSTEQCARILEIVRSAGWLNLTVKPEEPADGESRADIAVAWEGGGATQFVIAGGDGKVSELMAYFKPITDARFQRLIDRLPEAGLQKK